jgi:hypothetical protein
MKLALHRGVTYTLKYVRHIREMPRRCGFQPTARHDVYFYFKVPVIPPRRFAEVKGSPNSGHRMSTLRRPLDDEVSTSSRGDIYFKICTTHKGDAWTLRLSADSEA